MTYGQIVVLQPPLVATSCGTPGSMTKTWEKSAKPTRFGFTGMGTPTLRLPSPATPACPPVGALHLLADHVAPDGLGGEQHDQGLGLADPGLDELGPALADLDLLVPEDAVAGALEAADEVLGQALVRRHVPVADEDLAHRARVGSGPLHRRWGSRPKRW